MLRRAFGLLGQTVRGSAVQTAQVQTRAFSSSGLEVRSLVDFLKSKEQHKVLPYQFREPRREILLKALSNASEISDTKLPYIASNITSTDIHWLNLYNRKKLILAILKEDDELIAEYSKETTIADKIGALNFLIEHYGVKYSEYAGFFERLDRGLNQRDLLVLDMLNTIISARKLPDLKAYPNVCGLLCYGISNNHIATLPQATLHDLFEFALDANKKRAAIKLGEKIDVATLENPSLILKRCLEHGLNDLAFRIAEESPLDPLSTVVEFAVSLRSVGMMKHIVGVFDSTKIDNALERIIENATSAETVKFASKFFSEQYVAASVRKRNVQPTAPKCENAEQQSTQQSYFDNTLLNLVGAQVLLDLATKSSSKTQFPEEEPKAKVEVPRSVTHDVCRNTRGMSRSKSDDIEYYNRSYDSRADNDHSASSGSCGSDD